MPTGNNANHDRTTKSLNNYVYDELEDYFNGYTTSTKGPVVEVTTESIAIKKAKYLSYGITLTVVSWLIIIFIIVVIYAFFKCKMLSKSSSVSPIYVLSTWSLVANALLCFLFGTYVGPIIITQYYFFDGIGNGYFNNAISQLIIGFNYASCFLLSLIAINRVLVTYSSSSKYLLSRRYYNLIAFATFPISIAASFASSKFLKCCRIYMNVANFAPLYKTVLFEFDEDLGQIYVQHPIYTWYYVNRPIYIINSIIPLVCYFMVFGRAFWFRTKMSKQNRGSWANVETLRSIQFALIFLFYTTDWVFTEIINTSFAGDARFGSLVTVFMVFDAIMNAVLNATMNQDVREELKYFFTRKRTQRLTTVQGDQNRGNTRISIFAFD